MRIGKRLNILFFIITSVCVTVPILLLISFKKLNELQNLNAMVIRTQAEYNALAAYPSEILSYGFKLSSLASDWNTVYEESDANVLSIVSKKDIHYLPKEAVKDINQAYQLWLALTVNIEKLSEYFTKISKLPLEPFVKSAIEANGLLEGVEISKTHHPSVELLMLVSNVDRYRSSIVYGKEGFDIIITRISSRIHESIQHLTLIIWISGLSVAIGSSLIVFILLFMGTHSLVVHIRSLHLFAKGIGERNLTVRLTHFPKDEIGALGKDLNATIAELDEIIRGVKDYATMARLSSDSIHESAGETASATYEISSNIRSLDKHFDTVLDVVSTVVKSLEDMSSIIERLLNENNMQTDTINHNTEEIEEMSGSIQSIQKMSAEKAVSAEEIQQFVLEGDDKINLTNDLLSEVAANLDEIQELVMTINMISDQTNILSMNAAIESAHAGEAGKGFAVVAEEIRSLAETTSDNAKRIKETVHAITRKVENANSASGKASYAFDRVSEKVKDMLSALHEIADNVRRVDGITRTVNSRTFEIAESAKKINKQYRVLDEKQTDISRQMTDMSSIFEESANGIKEIDQGSADIVSQMEDVTNLSRETSSKMKGLDNILSEFTTSEKKEDDDETVPDEQTGMESA